VRSAVLLVGVHVVFSVILWFGFIGAAYGFSDGRVAWVVPVLGMLASTTAAVYYFTTLEHPAPLVGG
jgi:hypothetical protein